MTATVRPVGDADLDAVRALNAANVPEVGPLDEDRIALFRRDAAAFWVADHPTDGIVGLFVGLLDGQPYASPNYRWFAGRHERFAYVDRIALAPEARGTGLAATLYDRFARLALDAGRPVLCAEVNTAPPNPRSLRFHERRGFVRVAELAPYGGEERVAMLERPLTESAPRATTR